MLMKVMKRGWVLTWSDKEEECSSKAFICESRRPELLLLCGTSMSPIVQRGKHASCYSNKGERVSPIESL